MGVKIFSVLKTKYRKTQKNNKKLINTMLNKTIILHTDLLLCLQAHALVSMKKNLKPE